jgi:hypothetical protein
MISPYLYDFWPFLLLILLITADFFFLKPTGDVYSLLCSKKQTPRHNHEKVFFFFGHKNVQIGSIIKWPLGSGSIIENYGSSDPDPKEILKDPPHEVPGTLKI